MDQTTNTAAKNFTNNESFRFLVCSIIPKVYVATVVDNWKWVKSFSQYFGSLLLVLFHQYSMLVLFQSSLMLHVLEIDSNIQ